MTDYVLEILGGDRAGETFPLGKDRVVLGRKPGCDVVLADEKVSGRHAEIVFEDGRYVLRDLGSTNGTLLDGRRVEEIVLSPFDVLQLGRVRLVFRAADAASVAGDVELRSVDAEAWRRSGAGRRGGVVGLAALLVVALAAGAYVAFGLERDAAGPAGRPGGAAILRVPGNKLEQKIASCEEADGWDLAVAGAGFALGGPPHTGGLALEAERLEEGDTGAAEPFALARTATPVRVLPDEKLTLRAFVRTAGAARAVVRLRLRSSFEGERDTLCAGTEPTASERYSQVAVETSVPAGFDLVDVEVLALLDEPGARVLVDDVALVRGGSGVVTTLDRVGRTLVATPGSLVVRSPGGVVVRSVRPLPADARLAPASDQGLLIFTDLGARLVVEDRPAGFGVRLEGSTAHLAGMALGFDEGVAATGVLLRAPGGGFTRPAGEAAGESASELLLGAGSGRMLVRFAEPRPVRTARRGDRLDVVVQGAVDWEVFVDLSEWSARARELLDEAGSAIAAGRKGEALEELSRLIEELPHDDEVLRRARRLRAGLLDERSRLVEEVRAELDKARFFGTEGVYRVAQEKLRALLAAFGRERFEDPAAVAALQEEIDGALAALRARRAAEERRRLLALAEVFEKAGERELAKLVQGYMERRLPAAGEEGR